MNDDVSPAETSPRKPQPAEPAYSAPEADPARSTSRSWDSPTASIVQEWTGSEWVIVDATGCEEGFALRVLDPSRVQGAYLGERVVTACFKE